MREKKKNFQKNKYEIKLENQNNEHKQDEIILLSIIKTNIYEFIYTYVSIKLYKMHLTTLLIIKSFIICNILIFASAKATETIADSGNGGGHGGVNGGASGEQLDSKDNNNINNLSKFNNRLDKLHPPAPLLPPPQPPPPPLLEAAKTTPATTTLLSTTITTQLTTTSSPPTHSTNPTTRRPIKVCPGLHIRNDLKSFEQLRGCNLIDGPLTIALISNQKNPYEPKDYENITFPDLSEITDYLLFFRVEGLSTLSKLFPNLAVIRGKDLFTNYALIIYEMMNLQKIDLPKLTDILRGSVRIEGNPNLCYVSTVNWEGICKHTYTPHFIKDNNARCSNTCPDHCHPWRKVNSETRIEGDVRELGANNNRSLFCWNSQQCHDMCQTPDGMGLPRAPNGRCCSPQCAGGCYLEERSDECHSCRSVSQENKCVEQCDYSLFEYKGFCYNEQQCILTVESNQSLMKENQCGSQSDVQTSTNLKAIRMPGEKHGRCQQTCPPGYEEDPTNKNKCKPCDKGKCRKGMYILFLIVTCIDFFPFKSII